jgi:hypothetical protein
MDDARARVRGWLGDRGGRGDPSAEADERADDEERLLSTEGSEHREGARSTWRHAGDEPTEVEPHDDERPGLATYGPEDQTARVAPDPERSHRSRPAGDDQGLHMARGDDDRSR